MAVTDDLVTGRVVTDHAVLDVDTGDDLGVRFQPVIDVSNGAVIGYEVLPRTVGGAGKPSAP